MRKLGIIFRILVLVGGITCFADGTIHVKINGIELDMKAPPIVQNGRTLVPLRSIFESLGVTPAWNAQTQTVSAKTGQTSMELTIGSGTALINGKPVLLDTPGTLVNGSTMVPVRFVAETFGATVDWDAQNQTIRITTIEGDASTLATTPLTFGSVAKGCISAGTNHTVALKSDGSVVATGRSTEGACEVSDWKNVIAISAGDFHTIGVHKDGTVIAVGANTSGQCNVTSWENITAVCSGAAHTIGLRKDGTVVATGSNVFKVCNVNAWSDITAIAASNYQTVGLKKNGRVVVSSYDAKLDVSKWDNITAVSAGVFHTVGLKKDGTVVSVGNNDGGAYDVSKWEDIIAISAGFDYTLGLKKDGTVIYTGDNSFGKCNVQKWTGIIAISAANNRSVGLKTDGTVVSTGFDDNGKTKVTPWSQVGRTLDSMK